MYSNLERTTHIKAPIIGLYKVVESVAEASEIRNSGIELFTGKSLKPYKS